MKSLNFQSIIIAIILIFTSCLFADTIHLSNGTAITGQIENQTATDMFIRTPQGLRKVAKAQIRRVEYGDALKKQQELQRFAEEQKRQQDLKAQEEEKARIEAEQKRKSDEARLLKEEEEKQKQKNLIPIDRNNLNIRVFGGFQQVKPAILELRGRDLGLIFDTGKFLFPTEQKRKLSTLYGIGLEYNLNRFSASLEATTSRGKSTSAGNVLQGFSYNSNFIQQQFPNLGNIIGNYNIEDTITVDDIDTSFYYGFGESLNFQFRPFIGYRYHSVFTNGDGMSWGNASFMGSMSNVAQSLNVKGETKSNGATAGLNFYWAFKMRQSDGNFSLSVGYYMGQGKGSLDSDEFPSIGGVLGYNGHRFEWPKMTVKGPFVKLQTEIPISNQSLVRIGLKYEDYSYSFGRAISISKIDGINLSSLMQKEFVTSGNESLPKETIATFDLGYVYRLNF